MSRLCHQKTKNCVIVLKRYFSKTFPSELENHIRKAQSIEMFRSKFFHTIGSDVTISSTDIDDLVKENYVRPSILIFGIETLGSVTGTIYRYSPYPIKQYMISGVNRAVSDQFNGSLRDLQDDESKELPDNLYSLKSDIRETLKYHRDATIHNNNNDDKVSNSSATYPNIIQVILNSVFSAAKKL
jgi:demethoxyubiquinone hydroxylase (CLK1/Coq7/Cat5 family)